MYHIGEDVKYDVISNPKLVSFITPSFNDYTFIGYVDEAGADVSLDSVRALELTENKTIVLKAKFDKELEYVNVTLKNGEENKKLYVSKIDAEIIPKTKQNNKPYFKILYVIISKLWNSLTK